MFRHIKRHFYSDTSETMPHLHNKKNSKNIPYTLDIYVSGTSAPPTSSSMSLIQMKIDAKNTMNFLSFQIYTLQLHSHQEPL